MQFFARKHLFTKFFVSVSASLSHLDLIGYSGTYRAQSHYALQRTGVARVKTIFQEDSLLFAQLFAQQIKINRLPAVHNSFPLRHHFHC